MTTYARIQSGFAVDVQIAATATELAARFHPEWFAANPFTVVPDGTLHGARDNGNGTFTNPLPPPVVAIPLTVSKTAFMDVCQTAFGGGATGRQRFGAIIRACGASNDDEVRFVYERFQGAQTFDKQVVLQLMTLLISKGTALITPAVNVAERTAIDTNWPVQ